MKLSYPSRFQTVPKLSVTVGSSTGAPEGLVVPEGVVTTPVGAESAAALHVELQAITCDWIAYPMSLAWSM